MFMNVRKRDGRIVEFDSLKITSAIAKTAKVTGEFGKKEAEKLTARVLKLTHKSCPDPIPDVEEIQDIVEKVLFNSPYYKTTKAYILYREQHTQIRAIATKASVDLVETYLNKSDWKNNENSTESGTGKKV